LWLFLDISSNDGIVPIKFKHFFRQSKDNNTVSQMKYMEVEYMPGKNAKQQVQDVFSQLSNAKTSLNQALNSVEKPENKQQIQNTLNALENAINTTSTALSNYKD
jgi:predicted nucleotide-binding protein (sugar kinase/HSP70/actin superfamily)